MAAIQFKDLYMRDHWHYSIYILKVKGRLRETLPDGRIINIKAAVSPTCGNSCNGSYFLCKNWSSICKLPEATASRSNGCRKFKVNVATTSSYWKLDEKLPSAPFSTTTTTTSTATIKMMGGSSTRLLLALLFVLVMAMAPSICARVGPPLATYQKPVPLDQLVVVGFRFSLKRSRGQQPPPPTGNLPRFPSPPPLQPPPPPPPPPAETSCKEQLP